MFTFKLNSSSSMTRLLILIVCCFIGLTYADECKNFSKIPPNTDCTITKNETGGQLDYVKFHIAGLQLFDQDELNVDINNHNISLKQISDGLIILPKQDNYTFYLKTNSNEGTRKLLKFEFLNGPLKVQELNNAFNVFIKSGIKIDNKKPIVLSNDDSSTSILLGTDNRDVYASSDNDANRATNEQSLNDQDFYTADKKINLIFDKLDTKNDNLLNFNLLHLTKNCSGILTLSDNLPSLSLKTIAKENVISRTSYICAYVVKSNSNIEIDSIDLNTVGPFDTVQIKDGLKLSSNDLIYSKTKDLNNYLHQLDKTISSSNGTIAILSSSFIPSNYKPTTITIKKSLISKISKEGSGELKPVKGSVFIFSVQDKYPVLTINGGKTLKLDSKSTLKIYDCLDLNKEPILQFDGNDTVNSELWTETKFIVLKFDGSSVPQSIGYELKAKSVNCNKVSNHPATFILNGDTNLLDQTCSFYFRPVNRNRSVILNIESLILNANACLSLKDVVNQKDVFKFCQATNDDNQALDKIHLNELILPANEGYVLQYKIEKVVWEKRILIQALFAFNGVEQLREHVLNADQRIQTITSYDYPSNYPFILEESKDLDKVTADSSIFVTFEKYNLRDGDKLVVYNSNLNFTKGDVDDFIVGNSTSATVPIHLSTKFDPATSLISDSYASGFKMNLERVLCVLNLDLKNKVLQTPNWPEKVNATKCVATIDLTSLTDKKSHFSNITLQNGRKGNDFGRITLYDDSTISRNISTLIHVFNQTLLKANETLKIYNLTSNKMVLVFEPESDKQQQINGFKLTIDEIKDCPYADCDGKSRCLLESVHCNYVTECRDLSDESQCHASDGKPLPPEKIIEYVYRGLSGWVITLVVIPLSMISGVAVYLHAPRLLRRMQGDQYRQFNTFSDNA